MIQTLRQQEDIILYGNILQVSDTEEHEVIDFLRKEFENESLDFPYVAPGFDADAALWAAKTVYVAAQLILYRENKATDLPVLFPGFPNEKDAAAVVSADLCLRFLPEMIIQLKLIDTEDALIHILENVLKQWHYSGINYPFQEIEKPDFTYITSNACLHQLYINRIIENKNLTLAKHPACKDLILANLGGFADVFWKEFKTALTLNE